VNNKILSSSALVALLGGFSLLAACSGDDDPDNGSGGKGGSGASGGTGGSLAGTGGTAGATVGGVGGTAGAGAGGTAGLGGVGATAGSAGISGMSGTAGTAGSAGMAGMAGTAGAGGMAGDAGMGGVAGVAGAGMGGAGGEVIGAMAAYHFDMATMPAAGAAGAGVDGTEGWQINSGACNANAGATSVSVTQSADQFKAGTGSLKIQFTGVSLGGAGGAAGAAGAGAGTSGAAGTAGMGGVAGTAGAGGAAAGAAGAAGAAPMNVDCHVKKTAAPLETGKTVTYHIWIPPDAGGAVGWVKLIIEAGASYSWVSPPDVGGMPDIPLTTRSAWVMKTFTVPLSTVPPLQSIGFQFGVQNTFSGSFYIDEVTW